MSDSGQMRAGLRRYARDVDNSGASKPLPVFTFEEFERLSLPERQAYLERIRQDLEREQLEAAARLASKAPASP